MATLYVRNVPDDLYEALRSQAKARRRSIAAEVVVLLKENVVTERQMKARRELSKLMARMRKEAPRRDGSFPSAEEMIREDRER